MTCYRICLINSHFKSADEAQYTSLDAARSAAIVTATNIVSESISEGEPTSAVEIQIFADDELVSRQVVTLSVAEFTTDQ
ncbi:MAG TPA: hypothetical protein VE968_02110 [Sphingomicrobium sp.]|nr:hypothetical protein [Sphingomicrobium sp.]